MFFRFGEVCINPDHIRKVKIEWSIVKPEREMIRIETDCGVTNFGTDTEPGAAAKWFFFDFDRMQFPAREPHKAFIYDIVKVYRNHGPNAHEEKEINPAE